MTFSVWIFLMGIKIKFVYICLIGHTEIRPASVWTHSSTGQRRNRLEVFKPVGAVAADYETTMVRRWPRE